jgi:tetratricopeptide (TPR) repeat protein
LAKEDFKQILEDCETGVREGRVPAVKRRLAGLNGAQVPRELRLPFANLGRRTGMNIFGLRLLTPLVHGKVNERASQDELAEYAVLLQRTGSLDEALKILGGLDFKRYPQALLYLSFCRFNRWEYFEAVPLLREYLASPMPEYRKTVGQVNLAAALVATTEYREALDLLNVIEKQAIENQLRRLTGNVHEIRAQALFYLGELDGARSELEKAHAFLKSEGTVNELNVKKWFAVIQSFAQKNPEHLQKFRAIAVSCAEWEAVRHVDLCLLQLKWQPSLFEYHLFGTPWIAYREKAQRTLGKVISASYFGLGAEGGPILDLGKGTLNGDSVLPVGGKLHRCLSALTMDFYRPQALGAVFSSLFPGEHFDVFSSPNRVHQAMFRFRNWAVKMKLPMTIEHSREGYGLKLDSQLIISVPYERRSPDAHSEMYKSAITLFSPHEALTLREIAVGVGSPLSTVRRFCNWALDQGLLIKSGAGPATRYHLKATRASQIKTA